MVTHSHRSLIFSFAKKLFNYSEPLFDMQILLCPADPRVLLISRIIKDEGKKG